MRAADRLVPSPIARVGACPVQLNEFAPSPPAPGPRRRLRRGSGVALRARVAPAAHGADRSAVQWRMARNCSFAPGCLLAVFLCAVASCRWASRLASGGWARRPCLPLAGVELLALGVAFWVCARHAGDAETITLAERELNVEHRFGRGVESAAFRAEWVRVEPVHGEGSLVEISGQGQRMRVGRYLRPELRMALARELRQALRCECTRPAAQETQLELQR